MKKIILCLLALTLMQYTAFAAPVPAGAGTVEGYLDDFTGNQVKLEDYKGNPMTLTLSPNAILLIDQRPVLRSEFRPGMEIYAHYQGGNLTYLEGYSTANPGYLMPGRKMRQGVVAAIDRNQIQISLATGKQETYYTSLATLTTKKGVRVPLSSLYVGDRVKLFFDDPASTLVSQMQIEGDSILIKGLYRGKLATVDPLGTKVSLQDLQVLKDGSWQDLGSQPNKTLAWENPADIPLYLGGSKVSPRNLKYFLGAEVYLAVRNFFGGERIAKAVVKDTSEASYSDKISEINWYADAMKLDNGKNLSIGDGTIIVKDGRMIDKYALHPQSDAYILASGSNSQRMADVVSVISGDLNNSNRGQACLYAGSFDKILEDQADFTDFFLLDENTWGAFNDDKELYYDDDTYIYDLEAGKAITNKEFFTMDYSKEKGWFAYVYTDGDRIVGMVLKKGTDPLLQQRTTCGTVDSMMQDATVGWVATLRDARDWSSRKEAWMLKDAPLRVNIQNAMLIKNGKAVSPEDLRAGDMLYLVRDDFDGKVIVVK